METLLSSEYMRLGKNRQDVLGHGSSYDVVDNLLIISFEVAVDGVTIINA